MLSMLKLEKKYDPCFTFNLKHKEKVKLHEYD